MTENDVLLWPLRIHKCAGMCAHITHTHTQRYFLILWILTGNLPRGNTTQSGLDPPTSFSKKMLHRHAHMSDVAAILQLRFPLLWCHLDSLCLGWSYPPLTHHCVDFSLVLKGILTRHIPLRLAHFHSPNLRFLEKFPFLGFHHFISLID